MRNKRFRVIRSVRTNVKKLLNDLGYTKNDRQATDKNSKQLSVFIDVKRKEFWVVDEEALIQSTAFVKEVYNEVVIELNI